MGVAQSDLELRESQLLARVNEPALGGVHACGLDFILNRADFVCLKSRYEKGRCLDRLCICLVSL